MTLAFSFLEAQVKAGTWGTLYKHAVSMKDKRDKAKELYDIADESFKDITIYILREQDNYGIERSWFRRKDYEEWIMYTARTAAKLGIEEAAPYIMTLYDRLETSLYKGVLLESIGQTKNEIVVPWLNEIFRVINNSNREGKTRPEDEEIMLFGLLKSIRVFNDSSSFPHLFYARSNNYSSKIQDLADDIIAEVSSTPALLCKEVVISDPDLRVKFNALKYGFDSESSDEDKVAVCISAINQALGNVTGDDGVNKLLVSDILNTSVNYIGELASADPEAAKAIERKWNNDLLIKNPTLNDTNEQIYNIEALQEMKSEESARVLYEKFKYYNDMKKLGAKVGYGEQEGFRVLKAIIRAIGETGIQNEDILVELLRTSNAGEYGDIVQEEAMNAYNKLTGGASE